MWKVNLNKKGREENPYFYRFSFECGGRSFEFGLSREELLDLKEKSERWLKRTRSYRPSLLGKILRRKDEKEGENSAREEVRAPSAKRASPKSGAEKEARV